MSFSLNNICCHSPSFSSKLTHLQKWDAACGRSKSGAYSYSYSYRVLQMKFKHHFSWTPHFPLQYLHSTVLGLSNSQNYPAEHEGSMESKDSQQEQPLTTTKILEQLKRYGASGVLSYGLLNTAYYLTTFLLVWFFISPAPGKMGYLAAVSRFLKVMAMVWAGSQVTKLIRAAGALALAPLVDRGLSWFTARYKFESRGKAFFAIVAFCLSLAFIMFLVVTLLWA